MRAEAAAHRPTRHGGGSEVPAAERLRDPSGRLHVISLPSKPGDIARTRDWALNTDAAMAGHFHLSWPTMLVESRQPVRAVDDTPRPALWWDQERPDTPLPRRLPTLHKIFTDGTRFGRLVVAMREEYARPSGRIVIAPFLDHSGDIEPTWTRYPWQGAAIS